MVYNETIKPFGSLFMEIITHSERETEDAGAAFAAKIPDGAVVAMYGELGAGKTAFVRGMARGMGLDCRVSSPTFTIVNEYLGPRTLLHFDMYRLGGADELWDIGWDDYLERAVRGARTSPTPARARRRRSASRSSRPRSGG